MDLPGLRCHPSNPSYPSGSCERSSLLLAEEIPVPVEMLRLRRYDNLPLVEMLRLRRYDNLPLVDTLPTPS